MCIYSTKLCVQSKPIISVDINSLPPTGYMHEKVMHTCQTDRVQNLKPFLLALESGFFCTAATLLVGVVFDPTTPFELLTGCFTGTAPFEPPTYINEDVKNY